MARWEKIPSVNYRYEIDYRGNVRNAKTKKPLKVVTTAYGVKVVYMWAVPSKKKIAKSIAQLLWEVWGQIPPVQRKGKAVAVTLIKGVERRYFESFGAAAKFLAARENYSRHWAMGNFRDRRAEMAGWQVIYHEGEQRKFRKMDALLGLGKPSVRDKNYGKEEDR